MIEGGAANTLADLLVRDNIGSAKGGGANGILISGSDDNDVLSSDVIHNGPVSGISISGASDLNLVESNVVSENSAAGIRIDAPGATGNVVRANTVTANAVDGVAFSSQSTVEDNAVGANGFGALAIRAGDGIRALPGATAAVVQRNDVRANAGHGILVAQGALSNQILSNTSLGNARQATSAFDLNDANDACDNNFWSANVYGTANSVCTAL